MFCELNSGYLQDGSSEPAPGTNSLGGVKSTNTFGLSSGLDYVMIVM